MGIVLFLLLAAGVAAAIVVPLLPGRASAAWATGPSDEQIEAAVRRARRARAGGTRACAACGQAYQPADLFCVRCGAALAGQKASPAAAGPVCPSCGAALHEGDQFCAKCGKTVPAPAGEEAV